MDTNAVPVQVPSQSEIGDLFKRIDKVVPVKVSEKFEALYQYEEKLQWENGDLTNVIYDNVLAKKLKNKKFQLITMKDDARK